MVFTVNSDSNFHYVMFSVIQDGWCEANLANWYHANDVVEVVQRHNFKMEVNEIFTKEQINQINKNFLSVMATQKYPNEISGPINLDYTLHIIAKRKIAVIVPSEALLSIFPFEDDIEKGMQDVFTFLEEKNVTVDAQVESAVADVFAVYAEKLETVEEPQVAVG